MSNVILHTNHGDVTLALDAENSPATVANFLQYVRDGHYDNTVFHRVIPDFMIQGGGFDKDMKQKPTGDGIKNEWQNGLKNTKGTVAMARLGGRADSATSQFFINVKDNPALDRANSADKVGYCVFGKVIEGMDVVDKIKKVKTGRKMGFDDVPDEDVVIKSVKVGMKG